MNEYLTSQTLTEIAESFWYKAGGITQWPCDLEQAIAINLHLDVISLSSLTIKKIEAWLNERNIYYSFPKTQSRLHGCLLVYRDFGFIFIDGSDVRQERFYTLAHEVSHFILEYLIPRKNALALFGAQILEVLDGIRPPTKTERIDSIINSINIHPYVHLLEHDEISSATRLNVWQAENQADQLALELIAPFKVVCKDLKAIKTTGTYEQCYHTAIELLEEKFGLPNSIAEGYAYRLAKFLTGGPTVLSCLGLE